MVAIFTADSDILTSKRTMRDIRKLQKAVNRVVSRPKWPWRIQLNENKFIHVNFTQGKINYILIEINGMTRTHSNNSSNIWARGWA